MRCGSKHSVDVDAVTAPLLGFRKLHMTSSRIHRNATSDMYKCSMPNAQFGCKGLCAPNPWQKTSRNERIFRIEVAIATSRTPSRLMLFMMAMWLMLSQTPDMADEEPSDHSATISTARALALVDSQRTRLLSCSCWRSPSRVTQATSRCSPIAHRRHSPIARESRFWSPKRGGVQTKVHSGRPIPPVAP